MCQYCEPTYDGYVFWTGANINAFYYEANPTKHQVAVLHFQLGGLPLDFDIPYV